MFYAPYNRFGSHRSYQGKTKLYELTENNKEECFQVYFGGNCTHKRKNIPTYELDRTMQALQDPAIECKRLYVHASLAINLASENTTKSGNVSENSRNTLITELDYVSQMRSSLVVHPGYGELDTYIERLNDISIPSSYNPKSLLLENSAGKKNSIGATLEEYRNIFERLDDTSNISVCIDTCHTYSSGLCLFETPDEVTNLFDSFYDLLGHNVPMMHFNGSRLESTRDKPCRGDRHACIMCDLTVMKKKKVKGVVAMVEEQVKDYIWPHSNYQGLIASALRSLNGDSDIFHRFVKDCDNYESLERLIELSRDMEIDMISEMGQGSLYSLGVDINKIIVSNIYHHMT